MKRGMNPLTVIITLVIGSLMLILLITFLKSYVDKVSHYGDVDSGCRASVIAAANTKAGVSEHLISVGTKEIGKSDYGIDCPASEILVSGDDASLQLAEDMRNCWEKFGEGRLNPFPDWDPRGLNDQRICAVCSIIDLEEEITGFDNYLADSKMYRSDVTYLDYFTGGKGAVEKGDYSISLGSGKRYVSMFMLHKSKDSAVFWQAFGLGAGITAIPYTIAGWRIFGVKGAAVGLGSSLLSGYSIGVEYEDKYKREYSANMVLVPYEDYPGSRIDNSFGEDREISSSLQHFCDTIAVDVEGLR